MKNQIGIAVIGCGYWGGNYIRAFSEVPNTVVFIVCDKSLESLEKTRRRFPKVDLTTQLEDVLRSDAIDAVVIATNAQSHFAIAHKCLQAGKHVLLEKPMTTVASHAVELIQLAKARSLVLMVGHLYLYNAGVRELKAHVGDATDGSLYYMYSRRTNLGPIRNDVNVLWDLAPHDISIMNYLAGSTPEWVSAIGHRVLRNEREDVGFIVLHYPNNILGHVHVSWADPYKVREIVVVANDKRIEFNELNAQEPIRIFERGIAVSEPSPASYGEHQFSIRDGNVISPRIQIREPLREQCEHFIDCFLQGTDPLTNGKQGLEVVQVMEAINQSLDQSGVPVDIGKSHPPLPQTLNALNEDYK
jgi:predicted dehydrogenase